MKRINRKTKAEAISQILILVIGIIAISWMIGGEIEEVSAEDTSSCPNYCGKTTYTSNSVWEGKKNTLTGNCEPDYNKIVEYCEYGCSIGVCKDKTETESTGSNVLTSVGYPVATSFASNWLWTKYGVKGATTGGTTTSLTGTIGSTVATTTVTETTSFLPYEVISTTTSGTGTLGGFLFGTTTTTTTAGATATDAAITTTSWGGVGGGTIAGTIGSIAIWSAIAFIMGRYVIGPWLGLNTQQSQSLGYALAAGTAAGLILTSEAILGASAVGGPVGIAVGVVVAFAVFAVLAKKSSVDIIQYGCSQWDAQSGKGLTETQKKQRCELCNKQSDLTCTEYQCRSLGQGCVLTNDESSGRQLCIWENPNDIIPPIIIPWETALSTDFKYTPDNTISPPDKGVKIAYTGTEDVTRDGTTKCAPAFTPISFGVQLNEPAKCKINPLKLSSYAEMADIYMGRGIRDYNQSFVLSLPSKEAMEAENITADNGGKYELYVRCEDANGNANVANFVFKFCISEGPDTTPPLIIGTSILNNQPIAYGKKFIDINLYVNEPSECRWSHMDKDYEAMEENMTCATSVSEMNSQMVYKCKGNLTGLKDRESNKFYFKCKDQPYLKGTAKENERNANTQSYPLTLIGTQSLVIDKVEPEGIIKDSTNVVKVNLNVETSAGYEEGKAICSFSKTGNSGSYIDFFYGYDVEPFSQYQHSQELWLESGDYNYFITCRDKGGNTDNISTSFSIETDSSPPIAVRVYKEEDYLKVITDEPGSCVYSNYGCTYLFEDGIEMTSLEDKEYYTDWDINKDFYIKCKDEYGNMPLSNVCSIIARPFDIFEAQ